MQTLVAVTEARTRILNRLLQTLTSSTQEVLVTLAVLHSSKTRKVMPSKMLKGNLRWAIETILSTIS
ncbi:hypothetical protein KCU85_g344, partial [Aureobasidium melanogenum]